MQYFVPGTIGLLRKCHPMAGMPLILTGHPTVPSAMSSFQSIKKNMATNHIMKKSHWRVCGIKKPTDLIPLSRSWTHAPALTGLVGAEGGYNMEQRAYVLKVSGDPVSFTVNAGEESPVKNLCFVLKGWGSEDGCKNKRFRESTKQGTVRDTDGTCTKIIYIEKEGTEPFSISISK